MKLAEISGYTYQDDAPNYAHAYLAPAVLRIVDGLVAAGAEKRVFDLGCGNGSFAALLADRGFDVAGVDPSEEGIAQARRARPELKLNQGSAYDDLRGTYGQFPIVISLEVVEHVYSPEKYARGLFDLVAPGGTAIVSTPYHGYLKNLALALTGKLDSHFTALWEHGHIKFWSMKTLTELLRGAGFRSVSYERVGRVPTFAKSMIAIARK